MIPLPLPKKVTVLCFGALSRLRRPELGGHATPSGFDVAKGLTSHLSMWHTSEVIMIERRHDHYDYPERGSGHGSLSTAPCYPTPRPMHLSIIGDIHCGTESSWNACCMTQRMAHGVGGSWNGPSPWTSQRADPRLEPTTAMLRNAYATGCWRTRMDT